MNRRMGLAYLMRKYILSSFEQNKFSEDCHSYLFLNSLTFPRLSKSFLNFPGHPQISLTFPRPGKNLIFQTFFPDCGNPGPEVIKLFSCSTQLSMKFSPLINVKMPTIVGILTCMSGKNNILGLTEPYKGRVS